MDIVTEYKWTKKNRRIRVHRPKQRVFVSRNDAHMMTKSKMAESSDFEKKGAAVDGTLADDRSTAEGQVYQSEVHADVASERRYGESEFGMHEY